MANPGGGVISTFATPALSGAPKTGLEMSRANKPGQRKRYSLRSIGSPRKSPLGRGRRHQPSGVGPSGSRQPTPAPLQRRESPPAATYRELLLTMAAAPGRIV